MYASLGTTGVILSGEQEFALQAAKSALPACWAKEAEECVTSTNPTSFPNCAVIRQGYDIDEQSMIAAVDEVPFCPAPVPCPLPATSVSPVTCPPCPAATQAAANAKPKLLWLAVGVAAGVGIGRFVWR